MLNHELRHIKVLNNAFWHNCHLDSNVSFTERRLNTIIAHLKDRKKYPTLGTLANRKYHVVMNPDAYSSNLTTLRQKEAFRKHEKAIKDSINTLYPKTKNVRRILLKEKRVVLDLVKPVEHNLKHSLIKMFGKVL